MQPAAEGQPACLPARRIQPPPAPPTCLSAAEGEEGQHSPRGGGGAGQFPRGDWEHQQRGEPGREGSGRMGGLAAGMDIDVPPPSMRERGPPRGPPLDERGPPFDRRGPPPGRYDRDFDRGPPEFDRRGPPPPGRGGRFDRDLDREGGPPGPYGRGPPPGPGRFDDRGPPRPFRGPPDRFDERGPPPGPPFRGPPPPFRDFPPPGRDRSPPGSRCALWRSGCGLTACWDDASCYLCACVRLLMCTASKAARRCCCWALPPACL